MSLKPKLGAWMVTLALNVNQEGFEAMLSGDL